MPGSMNLLITLFIYFFATKSVFSTEVLRPRGVPLSKKIFYDPSRDFSCLDGSSIVPFNFVNDDYCDCNDGSDEPGTAACTNGMFYCTNAGHISEYIPSSRVNDGICDCCDVSDEYNSSAECISNCRELGQKAREDAKLQLELQKKGYELRLDLIKKGKQKKLEFKSKLEELKGQESQLEIDKEEKDVIKKEAEEQEKVVLDKYKKVEDENRAKEEAEQNEQHLEEERANAEEAFKDLDKNQDLVLSYQELQEFIVFDSNRDGVVSDDEAKFFLHMKDEMELEEFISTGWMIMKPIYMLQKITVPPTEGHLDEETDNVKEEEEDDPVNDSANNEQDDPEEEDDGNTDPPKFPPHDDQPVESKKEETVYDSESQIIIDAAKLARDGFNDADNALRKLKEDIRDLEESMEMDFGPDEEFAPLKDQCFEYTDREYTYRFCPFERAAQVPKSGGGEVSLGRGGKWIGPEGNKYTQMKLEGGMVCWNGPARTVQINLQCGLENKLISSSEPNRCEYHFDFLTPAMCTTPPDELHSIHEQFHEEL